MSTQISQEDHEEAIKELQEKYEKIVEAGIAKGVECSDFFSGDRKIAVSPNIYFPDQKSPAKILVGSEPFVGSE